MHTLHGSVKKFHAGYARNFLINHGHVYNNSSMKAQMLTTRQFAVRMAVHYRTALTWLDQGLVPGAKKVKTLAGEHWEIPIKALEMTPPKPGPAPKEKK